MGGKPKKKKKQGYPIIQEAPPEGFTEEAKVFGVSPSQVRLHEDSIQYLFKFEGSVGVSVITYTNSGASGNWDVVKVQYKDDDYVGFSVDSDDWYEENDVDLHKAQKAVLKIQKESGKKKKGKKK